jgi:hypothetical protein
MKLTLIKSKQWRRILSVQKPQRGKLSANPLQLPKIFTLKFLIFKIDFKYNYKQI